MLGSLDFTNRPRRDSNLQPLASENILWSIRPYKLRAYTPFFEPKQGLQLVHKSLSK